MNSKLLILFVVCNLLACSCGNKSMADFKYADNYNELFNHDLNQNPPIPDSLLVGFVTILNSDDIEDRYEGELWSEDGQSIKICTNKYGYITDINYFDKEGTLIWRGRYLWNKQEETFINEFGDEVEENIFKDNYPEQYNRYKMLVKHFNNIVEKNKIDYRFDASELY